MGYPRERYRVCDASRRQRKGLVVAAAQYDVPQDKIPGL
jgi:hypothetical protein